MEINLSIAELFLLLWAVLASVFAVKYQFEMKKAVFMLMIITATLKDIAEGRAKISTKNGKVEIEPILPLSKNER